MTLGENASNGVSGFQGNDTISVPDRGSFRNEHEYRRHVETTLSSFEAKLDVAKRQQLGYPIVDQGKRGWVDPPHTR